VDAPEPLALRGLEVVAAHERLEVRRLPATHRSSSSSASASRARAARVRVFTVPRGSDRKSAISLCDSPP
jgi:hypothetical protein